MMMLTLERRSGERRERQKMEKGESDIMSGGESSLSTKKYQLDTKTKIFFPSSSCFILSLYYLLLSELRTSPSLFLYFILRILSSHSSSLHLCVQSCTLILRRVSTECWGKGEETKKARERGERVLLVLRLNVTRLLFLEAINQTSTFCRWYFPFSILFSHFFTLSLSLLFFLSLFFFFSSFFTIVLRFVQLFPRTKVWSRIDWSTRNRKRRRRMSRRKVREQNFLRKLTF